MCALCHKPFVPLLFGQLSGVSTCETSCLSGSSLALPAPLAPGGRGGRADKGRSSQHRPDTRQQLPHHRG